MTQRRLNNGQSLISCPDYGIIDYNMGYINVLHRYTSNCTMTTCLNVRRIGGTARLRIWMQPIVEMRDEVGQKEYCRYRKRDIVVQRDIFPFAEGYSTHSDSLERVHATTRDYRYQWMDYGRREASDTRRARSRLP